MKRYALAALTGWVRRIMVRIALISEIPHIVAPYRHDLLGCLHGGIGPCRECGRVVGRNGVDYCRDCWKQVQVDTAMERDRVIESMLVGKH